MSTSFPSLSAQSLNPPAFCSLRCPEALLQKLRILQIVCICTPSAFVFPRSDSTHRMQIGTQLVAGHIRDSRMHCQMKRCIVGLCSR